MNTSTESIPFPQARQPLVSVIVVSWNGIEHLRRCLAALAAQTFQDFEVVVVDNASNDGSPELVERDYPGTQLIRNRHNLGFAAANNLAIRGTSSRYVVTLNNDAIPEPDWLQWLVSTAEEDPTVGAIASKMVFADRPEVVNSCGIAMDAACIAWDLWGGYPAAVAAQKREVFGACAGAALYRRELLDDVGLFDEDFFAYSEDVDLAWRARHRGWRVVLQPHAVVRHVHAGTLGEGSPRKRFLLARNKIWTVAKNFPEEDAWPWLPVVIAYDIGAAVFGTVRQHDWASVRGRIVGLCQISRALQKRRRIQAGRRASAADVRQFYAPLVWPWEVPRRYKHLVRFLSPGTVRTTGRPTSGARSARRQSPRRIARLLVLRWVGRILTSRKRNPSPVGSRAPRIVALRPDHLGDVLLARPALEHIRREMPQASLTAIVGPWGAPALQGMSTQIISFEFPGFTRHRKRTPWGPYIVMLALATRLRREHFDVALILRSDHWWGAMACALAGVPCRIGIAIPETQPFLTRSLPVDPAEPAGRTSERVARAVIEPLGSAGAEVRARAPSFPPSQSAERHAFAWCSDRGLADKAFVVIHPGAGAALKSWPVHRWATIADELPAEVGIVITGTQAEEHMCMGIRALSRRPIALAMDLSWDTLAALYQRAALVIGMDSGPLHLAAAVGTPTVRAYGPTDPRIYGPVGHTGRHHVLSASLPCAPCGDLDEPPCGYRTDPPCLASISAATMVDAARMALKSRAPV